MKLVSKRLIPLVIALVLLVYALKDISFQEIFMKFRQAEYIWIFLYAVTVCLIYFLRGKRWQQSLIALGHAPTAFRTTVAIQSGMIASMILLGSGEITRCLTLQRTDGVSFSHSAGSVVAERVLDLIMLFIVILLAFALEFGRMEAYIAEFSFTSPITIFNTLIGGVLIVGFVYCLWKISSIKTHKYTYKLIGFGKGLWRGFLSVRHLTNPTLFIALTLLIQLAYWITTYCLLLSLDITSHLPPTAALTILAVSSIGGLAVPTQGGIGTYHFLVSRALVLYGLSTAEGAVVATFMHAVGFAINLVLSSISFLIIPVLIQQRNKEVALEAEKERKP